MTSLDLSYVQAEPVLLPRIERIRLVLVGLGGTGSFLARHAACMALLLHEAGKQVELTFVDPDIVEAGNLPRQNFCAAELGRYKAEALATRYARDFGLEIRCRPVRFSAEMVGQEWNALTLLLGCVDNAAARIELDKALKENETWLRDPHGLPRIWYLDAGNGLDYGQVLLGCVSSLPWLASAFARGALSCCSLLPSPLLQEPGLRQPRPEEEARPALSCAEQLAANTQSLMINPAMALEMADYLYRLLIGGGLKKFATYLDLPAGTKRSLYTTPRSLATVLHQTPSFFQPRGAKQA